MVVALRRKNVKNRKVYESLNKEKWLSGLKHWFAKSTYKTCIMGSNPFFSDRKINNLSF